MTVSVTSRVGTHTVERALAHEVIRQSGRLVLPAIGGSMLPAIWPGDSLVIEPTDGSKVEPGDIVMFSSANRFVAHRVIKKDQRNETVRVLTRGDSMSAADAPITPSQILGKISFIVRNGKCFELKKNLRYSQRLLAALLRRSETSARVLLGIREVVRASVKSPRIRSLS